MLGPDKARGTSVSRERQFRVEIDTSLDTANEARASERRPSGETPFRMALVGDFSGRASRGIIETGRALGSRRPLRIDRDNVDDVVGRLAPELHLTLGEARTTLRFADLDDFHPDRLYVRLPAFRSLRETRERAAAPIALRDATRQAPRAEPGRTTSSSNVLDQILGDVPPPPGGIAAAGPRVEPARATQPDALTDFVRRVVAPHVVQDTVHAQPERVEEVDALVADDLRAVLHHPAFRALEATWRATDFLVRRVETDASLQIHLIDASKAELLADLESATDLTTTGTHRLFVEASGADVGDAPWALVVGLFDFGPDRADLALLRRIGAIARRAGVPFLAAATSRLVGCRSFGAAPDPDDWDDVELPEWDAFRRSADARYVGLAAPRYLLRLPYGGRDGEPCDVPAFSELSSNETHEEYLWGNSAVLAALLYAESFASDGWALRPRLDVLGLPLHLVRANGEVTAKPCAEAVLSARAVDRLLERGVIAVQSQKEGDAVRLARMQSVADPLAALAVSYSSDHADD
jgi:type VI secretion system protein ImpC